MTAEKDDRIFLFKSVRARAVNTGSLYTDAIPCRDDLLEYMDSNDWFGSGCVPVEGDFLINGEILEHMDLWLKTYGKSRTEKISLMLEAYRPIFPRTCARYRRFLQDNHCGNTEQDLRVLDFVLSAIDREIDQYDADGIQELIKAAGEELKLEGLKLFTSFLNQPVDGIEISAWTYEFKSRQVVKQERGAYALEEFSLMAYTVFSPESWQEHDLINKAAEKKRYADLWLFTALHFVCALRRTDILKLPVPSLPYEPEDVRNRIRNGIYTGEEARGVTEEFLLRVRYKPRKPHKTQQSPSVPELKLFIPESVIEPFGVILSLSASYHELDDPFVDENMAVQDIRRFFGDEFAAAAGNKKFYSRRANKSYLQGIESAADADPGRPKGYMLAALARSHKGGIGTLPQMTDVYLRDAKFSGYSPEFILREMFERGVFGFIPAMLLEMYGGKEYLRLDVSGQTQLIREIGLDACQLERIADTVVRSFKKSSMVVKSLVLDLGGGERKVGEVLQRIASGAAPSKQDEFLCLMSAAGYVCPYADRMGCMGCDYEIYTKSSVYLLMKEYVRLTERMRISDKEEHDRIQTILETGILPALAQILSSIQMMWPDSQMEPIFRIVERGLDDADHNE